MIAAHVIRYGLLIYLESIGPRQFITNICTDSDAIWPVLVVGKFKFGTSLEDGLSPVRGEEEGDRLPKGEFENFRKLL